MYVLRIPERLISIKIPSNHSITLAKQIKIQDYTYKELTSLGKKNETYDDIIKRCIESHKRELAKEKKK